MTEALSSALIWSILTFNGYSFLNNEQKSLHHNYHNTWDRYSANVGLVIKTNSLYKSGKNAKRWCIWDFRFTIFFSGTPLHIVINTVIIYACVKGHLEPTHLKSSPLFTFSTKLLGQDSPSIHLSSKIIGSRFTTAKIKLGEDSPSWFAFSRSRFAFKQRKK